MTYRIAQWGTGNLGLHGLRMIIEDPDLELVGLRVYDPSKVGVDAGVLVGGDAVGIIATDDGDAILAMDLDCVMYAALSTADGHDALADICPLLESGKNVVSSADVHYNYVRPGVSLNPAGYARIMEACTKGNSSLYVGGINPGFGMDQFPITMSRMARRIDKFTVTEVVDCTDYKSVLLVESMGFGLPPDAPHSIDLTDVIYQTPYYTSMRMLADTIGAELEDVKFSREVVVADKRYEMATGPVEPGTVAAQRLVVDGYIHGEPRLTFEWIWRVAPADEVAPEWEHGEFRWIVRIEGDPIIESEFTLATTQDAGRGSSPASAALLLNAVPAVCAAPPGLVDELTRTSHGGGYFLPRS